MEKLTLQLIFLHKALKTLQAAFDVCQKAKKLGDQELVLATEDSIIQRFEYTFDSFWKTLKKYIETKYKVHDTLSPNSVFRFFVEQNLCSPQDGELLIRMTSDRNATTHTYDFAEVREILPNIPHYYQLMTNISDQLENTNR